MYKLLLFLKKTDDEEVNEHFRNFTLKRISDVIGREIKTGDVESSLLLDVKYSKFCEASVESKDEWDNMMNTKAGRELNNDLMEFHSFVDLIFVDYK